MISNYYCLMTLLALALCGSAASLSNCDKSSLEATTGPSDVFTKDDNRTCNPTIEVSKNNKRTPGTGFSRLGLGKASVAESAAKNAKSVLIKPIRLTPRQNAILLKLHGEFLELKTKGLETPPTWSSQLKPWAQNYRQNNRLTPEMKAMIRAHYAEQFSITDRESRAIADWESYRISPEMRPAIRKIPDYTGPSMRVTYLDPSDLERLVHAQPGKTGKRGLYAIEELVRNRYTTADPDKAPGEIMTAMPGILNKNLFLNIDKAFHLVIYSEHGKYITPFTGTEAIVWMEGNFQLLGYSKNAKNEPDGFYLEDVGTPGNVNTP